MAAIQGSSFEILDHAPYSPDLAPSDFYLFPRLKEHLRVTKFEDDEEVKAAVNDFLSSQDEIFFKMGVLALEKRFAKCIDLKDDYVEK